MDLHHSENQNLYLKQSYLTSNPINRSALHSRIIYHETENSFLKWIKWAGLIFGLLLLAFFLMRMFGNSNEIAQCQGESNLSYLYHYLEANIFGKVDHNRCKSKKEESHEETDTQRVHTITEIKTCPLEKEAQTAKDPSDWYSTLSKFQLKSPDCEKLRLHNEQLANQKPSVRLFTSPIPDLEDIKEYPYKYAKYKRLAEEKMGQNLKPEIEGLFRGIENETNKFNEVYTRDITKPEFLEQILNLDSILAAQLKSKNLLNSGKNLVQKDGIIQNLRKSFDSITSDKNCEDSLSDIKKAIALQNEKKDYSLSLIQDYNSQLNDLNNQKKNLISQKSKDSSVPLSEMQAIEKEIEDLNNRKSSITGSYDDPEGYKNKGNSLNGMIDKLNDKIKANRAQIVVLGQRMGDNDGQLGRYNSEYQALVIELSRLKIRLQINAQHAQIKMFLESLIKNDSNSEKLVEKMVSESEMSKSEMFKIVKAFMAQTQGYDVETTYSEDEIKDLMEKDQKEFEEVMKVYKELKDMIQKFKNISIDLVTDQNLMNVKEKRRLELTGLINGLKNSIQADSEKRGNLETEIEGWLKDIDRIRGEIANIENKSAKDTEVLKSIEMQLNLKRGLKGDLEANHRVI